MSIAEVLDALAWHIAVAHPEFASEAHRQVWRADGVALIPLRPERGNGIDEQAQGSGGADGGDRG